MTNQLHYRLSNKDTWITPPSLVNDIRNALGTLHLDPCAHEYTEYAETNYRLEDGQDGLELSWDGNSVVNPPFSYKGDWLEKAIREVNEGNSDIVVVITPDSTDVISWWHQYIAEEAQFVCFLEGRLSYVREETDDDEVSESDYVYDSDLKSDNLIEANSPTFGTALSVFVNVDNWDKAQAVGDLRATLRDWGHVMETV